MENHTFNPIPYPESPIQPCWKVEVCRKGVDEPVGCLEVNPQTLPPRKANKKNKVLWKLPDTLDDAPRFGGLEKERLWALFKQQKKERRRSKKKVEGDDQDNAFAIGGSFDNVSDDTGNKGSNGKVNKNGESNGQKAPAPPEPPVQQQQARKSPPPTVPAPPPGFGMGGLSLSDQNETPSTKPMENHDDRNTDPGGPAMAQAQTSPPDPVPKPPNPEPPAPMEQQQLPNPTTSPELSFVFGALTAQELLSLPPPSLSSLIGSHVAKVLIHSLTTPGQLSFWLAHYHPQAQKLLSFGTAQAVAHTAADRKQQWESLIINQSPNTSPQNHIGVVPPTPSWDCQGWTVQTMFDTSSMTTRPQAPSLLIVLNGRTLQRQEILTYHLTLILRPVPTAEPQPPNPPTFQIHNEILSLTRTSV